jgi:hypothetical protein
MSTDIAMYPAPPSSKWWKRTDRLRTSRRNGIGYALLIRFYLGEASWWSFNEQEQAIIAKTARSFAKALREEGFLREER